MGWYVEGGIWIADHSPLLVAIGLPFFDQHLVIFLDMLSLKSSL